MSIALYGGPFDGGVTEGLSHLPVYMIATNHCDHPIYKKACCCKTESNHHCVPYVFVGYESQSHIWADQNLEKMDLKN